MISTSPEEKLKERIKELTCLYEISTIVGRQNTYSEALLREISENLKKAWRFSEDAVVETNTTKYSVVSAKIPASTIFQKAEIVAFEEQVGVIKVHYPAPPFQRGHFLEEEQKLLDKVAGEIGFLIERSINKEKESLLQRRIERQDRLTILGEITAGIAHELNTPLGNILGFAELIAEKTKVPQVKEDVKKIIDGAIFSREVVKKLMFFACEMPQQMEFKLIPPIITEALQLLGPSFKKAEINYKFICEAEDLKIQLDAIQLTQVLFNILINAIYISPAGSTIEIRLYEKDGKGHIEIADEGPGVPDEIKHKIFEPFFSTKPVGEGSGLGLSVVHGIVKSHKGEIHCYDNIPKGTVFLITLPFALVTK